MVWLVRKEAEMCSILAYCSEQADPKVTAQMLSKTISRGPDDGRILNTGSGFLGFNRLSIMGLTPEGMQPFMLNGNSGVCNGELYGFRRMKEELIARGYPFKSGSDCEILLPLYEELDVHMFEVLDAEFALVIYDGAKKQYIAARDPVGIRPLYYGRDEAGAVVLASEAKNLVGICSRIMPFPPGSYAVIDVTSGRMEVFPYRKIWEVEDELYAEAVRRDDMPQIARNIHDKLLAGIEKRLDSDAPLGFLLSGGLDSSLVCGAAARILDKPLQTFAIGMDKDAIDLKYARKVAEYIGSEHHEVFMTREEVIAALDEVIHALGTYDITTIRASMGMYLLCKWIHENTDIRVILTGEISDEIFVPFGDLDFVRYCMAIDPEKKLNRYGIGKYLLRHAFEEDGLIPREILMREKAAFSDAVGHSMRLDLIEYAQSLYSDEEFEARRMKYTHARPFTKESLMYREIFEKYYPGQSEMVADFWMPNRSWEGCDVNDPSASVLSNYGKSGE